MAESDRQYFRVPCDFQIRYTKLSNTEFEVFESHSTRPSTMSSVRMDIHNLVSTLDLRDGAKSLIEHGVNLLLSIDQRLDRLEENVLKLLLDQKDEYVPYHFVHGEIGAVGMTFETDTIQSLRKGDRLLCDFILPDMPEHRIVAALEVKSLTDEGGVDGEFVSFHHDDQEFLHRFIRSRERQILRQRAQERER